MMFIHLHTHSYYSFLEGLHSPGDLARTAAAAGMDALALTDHTLTGAIEFYDACQGVGVRPILGLELSVANPSGIFQEPVLQIPGKLVLYAIDLAGWASLCRLSSIIKTETKVAFPGGLPFDQLAEHTDGLLCLTGGRQGLAARLILQGQEKAAATYLGYLNELFPDRLYVELHRHDREDDVWIAGLQHHGLPIVATNNIHYLTPEETRLQKTLTAIRLNRPMSDLPPTAPAPPGSHYKSAREMEALFYDFPEAISATCEVAERCQLELPLGVSHYPEITLPPDITPIEALRGKAENGALRHYGEITPAIRARLDHELTVIGECGYASLFLIMEEIIQYARQSGVPVSSRGSAASSLVAYCLGITSPDPIRLNLYFERFLNPARASPPDIDTDLCSRRRDGVIRFVYDRYGDDRVAMVSTINRFRRRSALREVAKAHGLPSPDIDLLVEGLPHRWWGPRGSGSQNAPPYSEFADRFTTPLHTIIFEEATALLGSPRHLSVHPGGVVIAPGKLTDLVPTQIASKGVVITQFDLKSIERLGLVKIDLLGIRGLTVLGDVAQAIQMDPSQESLKPLASPHALSDKQNQKSPSTSMSDLLEAIPDTDLHTEDLIQNGRTIGCFQIESPGMRATLKEIQARSVDDIMVALALYRPGPLTGGLKDAFVRRHRGEEKVKHLHTALTPLLADTYGVILYQEQVLHIAHELAGLDLADADLLRRAMSHFDPGKQLQTLKEKFIAGAETRSSVPAAVAGRVWELMAAFAGYGFPKAHAASYAQVAWRSAWCKTHHPAVFMTAVLANWGGYYSQRVYLMEARRMGLTIRPPHINHSRREFTLRYLGEEPVLFMGLDQVRNLTRRTQSRILRQRPFNSFTDFLERVDPRPVEAENLVRSGALEGLGTIPTLLQHLGSGGWRKGQLSLFAMEPSPERDWSLKEKVAAQETILGIGVTAHPLDLLSEQIAAAGACTTVEAAALAGQTVKVAGIRQTWRRTRTSRGEYLYFMSLEDLEGMLDVVIFANVYRHHRAALSGPGPYIIEGDVELDETSGKPILRAERVWEFD